MIKHHALKSFIAHLSDIPIFYIKYLKTHKVHVYAGAIRQLLYGCVYVRVIILPYIRTHHTITYTKPEMVSIIYRVKSVSHDVNSHVLTSKNNVLGNSRAVDARLLFFTYRHSRPS